MSEDAAIIEHRGPRRRAGLELAAVALGLLFVAVLIQRALNAYDAEFLGDDHSHYISGLFVRDYIAARLPNPLAYLKSYQSHYPLIGIGHWGSKACGCCCSERAGRRD